MIPFTEYVVGFMFSESRDHLVLIQKRRPRWQDGKFNGPGGKVDRKEGPREAMVREFKEECGVATEREDWTVFAVLDFPEGRVYFLSAFDDAAYRTAHTVTDEMVVHVSMLLVGAHENVIPNLRYLVPLALNVGAADSGSRLTLPVRLWEEKA